MKFDDLGISNSLLWFLISIFLFFWLGNQLFGVITKLEIQNLRVTNTVLFDTSPVWFSVIVGIKTFVWAISLVVICRYVQSKINKKTT
jgi:hypothetical protein